MEAAKLQRVLIINDDGETTLADGEKGACIVVNSRNEGKFTRFTVCCWILHGCVVISLAESKWLNIRPQNSEVETVFYKPCCLRVTVGVSGDEGAEKAGVKFQPEHLNGRQLFGKNKVGDVPLSGVSHDELLEVAVDITHLYEEIADDKDGKARVFIKFQTVKGSKATGEGHQCSVRSYSANGEFSNESVIVVDKESCGNSQESSVLRQYAIDWIMK